MKFTKTFYRQCDECGHEFEIELSEDGTADFADGVSPEDKPTVGTWVWAVPHKNESGGDCDSKLILEEDGSF